MPFTLSRAATSRARLPAPIAPVVIAAALLASCEATKADLAPGYIWDGHSRRGSPVGGLAWKTPWTDSGKFGMTVFGGGTAFPSSTTATEGETESDLKPQACFGVGLYIGGGERDHGSSFYISAGWSIFVPGVVTEDDLEAGRDPQFGMGPFLILGID